MIRLRITGWLMIPLLILLGCTSDKNAVLTTTVQLAGDVVNQRTQRGVPNAAVSTIQFTETTSTDSNGHYVLEVTTGDSFRGPITIIARASGYTSDSVDIMASSGRQVVVPAIQLKNLSDNPDTSVSGPSGPPATILFVGATDTSIGVRETGIIETAILTYEVRDIRGIPVDLNNLTTVHFRIDGATGGGEYLGNDTAVTNENGRAQVSIISGIRPGTVQIVATVHDTIRARPVRMSIHTGPPDSVHTTIGFSRINFPGLNWVGRIDSALALIGDRYSNPVPVGTEAYFSSDHGVIQPQGFTNFNGMTTVPLFSGHPFPAYPDDSTRGWSVVHVQTVDWTGQRYTISGSLLWTGLISNFTVNPSTFNIPNNGSGTFSVHVSDIYDHPLSSGTTFQVASTFGNLSGDVNLVFPDTWSSSWTNFSFVLADPDTDNVAHNTAITITVNGDNGRASRVVSGVVN